MWKEIKMLSRWCIASFLLARVIGLTETEASPALAEAYMAAAEEFEKYQKRVCK